MSQLENRPTSQQETASGLLTWVINFFVEACGVVIILRNNSWSLNFHPFPWQGSSWYWEFFCSTDTLKKKHLQSGWWWWWLALWKQVSFLYCLLLITALSILPVPPLSTVPSNTKFTCAQWSTEEKNGCYQGFWMTRSKKRMAFLYFPPKLIF